MRLPYLWSIPQFTDETQDYLWSYSIYEGRRLPLHNRVEYIGSMYNYVEAAGFWLLNGSLYTPRLISGLLGALTVVPTYFLARQLAGGPAAWLAAGLLATSPVHVAGNSHIGWSHSATPLFLALALVLLERAAQRSGGWSLLGAGFAAGLTVQSHMVAFAFLPGAALYLLLRGRPLLHTRWPYLAACLFVLAYSNMIVHNLSTGFASFDTAQSRDAAYGEYSGRGLQAYLEGEGRILMTLLRLPTGAVGLHADSLTYLRQPSVIAYAALTVAGLVLLARKGVILPVLVVLSAAIIFPIFNAQHELLPRQGRYLAPLLPLLFTALAAAACQIGARLCKGVAIRGVSNGTRSALGLVAATLLVVFPLLPLARYYAASSEAGQTNDRFFQLLARVEGSRPNNELVLLDSQLAQERSGAGGTALRTMNYLLTARRIPHTDLTFEPDRIARRYGDGGVLLVMAEKTYTNIGSALPLQSAAEQQSEEASEPYRIYHLGPAYVRAAGSAP